MSVHDAVERLAKKHPRVYKEFKDFAKKHGTFPLITFEDVVIAPLGDPQPALDDPRFGRLQAIGIFGSQQDMDEQNVSDIFHLHESDVDRKSFLLWMDQRIPAYYVDSVQDVNGDRVTLGIRAALADDVFTKSTDTLSAFKAEMDPAMWGMVEGLIDKFKSQPVGSRQPIQFPENLGERPSGRAKKKQLLAAPAAPLPVARLTIVPKIKQASYVRDVLRSLLKLSGQELNVDLGDDRIATPHCSVRGLLVPPSLVPEGDVADALRVFVTMLHCSPTARTDVEVPVYPPLTKHPNAKWFPDEPSPRFERVLEALVAGGVHDCVLIILACGGWSKNEECVQFLKQLAVKHQLILVLSQRLNFQYCDPTDPTLLSFVRFGAAILPEVSRMQHDSNNSLTDQLLSLVLEQAKVVLAPDSATTRPVIINHLGRMQEIVSPSLLIESVDDSSSCSSIESTQLPPTVVAPAMDAVFRVAQQLASAAPTHATVAGTLGQVSNKFQWLVIERGAAYYVLILRGESMDATLFKGMTHNIKDCHNTRVRRGEAPSKHESVKPAVIEQLVVEYTSMNPTTPLWLAKDTPFACTLYPIASPSVNDCFVQKIIGHYFSKHTSTA